MIISKKVFKQLFFAIISTALVALLTACDSGSSGSSDNNTDQQISAPGNVVLTSGSKTGTITVSWDSVEGADSYNIYWGTVGGVTTGNGTLIQGAVSPYDHSGLIMGTDYFYIVTAVNTSGSENASVEASGYPYLSPMKTNQTVCYDGSGVTISCTGTGQDGEYQRGRVADFTAPIQHPVYTADYTTTDNITGLTWKSCSEGQSGAMCTGTAAEYVNDGSINDANAQCDVLNGSNSGFGYAGITSWRVPAVEELETLLNYGSTNPASFDASFPAINYAYYWSSSAYMQDTTRAWAVSFSSGEVLNLSKTSTYSVRCVAGLYAPAPVYVDNGNGTVRDKSTGLLWQKCSMGQNADNTCSGSAITDIWDSALTYCNTLTLAGKTWRLPNGNELKSITDRTVASTVIDTTIFPATVAGYYWSSSSYPDAQYAWYVRFSTGEVAGALKNFTPVMRNARCVSGP